MKKLALAAIVAITLGLAACGGSSAPVVNGEIPPETVMTGSPKTRAEVLVELAEFQAACKADATLAGCNGEAPGQSPVVGTAKTRAEVSAELAAFIAACKASPALAMCFTTGQ